MPPKQIGGLAAELGHLIAWSKHSPEIVESHRNQGKQIADASSGISEDIGQAAIALEARVSRVLVWLTIVPGGDARGLAFLLRSFGKGCFS